MTPKDRELRGSLVRAAEAVVREHMLQNRSRDFNRTQLSQLIAVCRDALCAEEIESYLRYQAGRRVWPIHVAQAVIEKAREELDRERDAKADETARGRGAPMTDEDRVKTWCRFATYVKRAYVYGTATPGTSPRGAP